MAWSDTPEWKVISHQKTESLSIQSRTRTGWRVATTPVTSYWKSYQYEQRRTVQTSVEEKVSEAYGLTENAVAVSKSLYGVRQDGSYSYTEISKTLANPAGAYTFRKLERTVSITEGLWTYAGELEDDSQPGT